MSLPARLLLRAIGNILLLWAMATYLTDYISIGEGWAAFIVIGSLLTLLNVLVRPLVDVITLPIRLLANLLAFLLVNGFFVWITQYFTESMNSPKIFFEPASFSGWIVVIVLVGLSNWILKHLPHAKKRARPAPAPATKR